MANQYSGNFEQIIRNRFKCSAKDILLVCKKRGFSYYDAEKFLGFKHVTIRKWAKRFDIKLIPRIKRKEDILSTKKEQDYIKQCKKNDITKNNIFSRSWINNLKFYKSSKAKS
ncbi:hypothetical protein ACFPDQ_03960 [Pseudofrancisella aestuarii]|uniref:Transposase n=1 Tax=Pseudofrancisella aestuarii TaxID=2670347 RepID=A0ABV9TAQ0_9GAMM|nr:hypothetical protein [Pseudofrancisella aestuarii]